MLFTIMFSGPRLEKFQGFEVLKFFPLIGKSLSPLGLELVTSHKPSLILYHLSQASRFLRCV